MRNFPRRQAIRLGYCKLGDTWELATQRATLVQTFGDRGERQEELLTAGAPAPLLASPRNIRAKVMRLIPRLLDVVESEAEDLLHSIEEAEKSANKL